MPFPFQKGAGSRFSRIRAIDLCSAAMQTTASVTSRFHLLPRLLLALLVLLMSGKTVSAQRQTGVIVQDAPLVLLPEKTRGPLLIMEKGVIVQVNRREGDWFNITVQGSQWGDRAGYVEAKYLQIAETTRPSASALPNPVPPVEATKTRTTSERSTSAARTPPVAAGVTPVDELPAAPRAPRPVADVSLKNVRRIFIEPMPGDLDQYISAEITKELKGRVVVVLDKANADVIMRGVGENKNGVGAAITGRYLGLHDNSTASVTLVDSGETVVLWASEAGDRSLMWGALARGGQRKVASRLVNNLKKALNDAK